MGIFTYVNVVSIIAVLTPLVVAVVVPLFMVGAYRRFRGNRIVTCPETEQPAAVEVDARHATMTAVFGQPSLRVKTCSRWPKNRDCGQECLDQIEASPEDLIARWSAGKTCALCGRPIGAIGGQEYYPALMDMSGKTFEWQALAAQKLPEALATHVPVCWSCHRRKAARRRLLKPVKVAVPGQRV